MELVKKDGVLVGITFMEQPADILPADALRELQAQRERRAVEFQHAFDLAEAV